MMVGKEDLGLSLSLGPLHHHHHHHLSIMPKSTSTCTPVEYWPSRPIDVNRAPTSTERDQSELEVDQQAGGVASSSTSPNTSTVSNSAGSGGKRDRASAMIDQENDQSERGIMSDVEEVDADGSRKKLRLSKDQSVLLEESFKEHNTLNQKQKVALAKQLKLRARQVEVWFQNRRARTKLKQTEVDCEILKRCCEGLTEENRRLQKEVQELRALKIMSPTQMYTHMMTPPTTLTMCPSCERIISSTSAQPTHHHHHRSPPPAAGVPWAPIPLRSTFPQRS